MVKALFDIGDASVVFGTVMIDVIMRQRQMP